MTAAIDTSLCNEAPNAAGGSAHIVHHRYDFNPPEAVKERKLTRNVTPKPEAGAEKPNHPGRRRTPSTALRAVPLPRCAGEDSPPSSLALAKRGGGGPREAWWRGCPSRQDARGLGVTSQFGFARKPLNSLDSRKKEAWISLPLALNFLPNDLDFPSPGFANPSAHFVKYSRFTWNCPAASRVHRAPRGRRGALLREGTARRFKMCECGRASGQRPAKVLDAA